MKDLKMSLVDNDYVVRVKTQLPSKENNDNFNKFFREIDEELIPGKTAYLEVESSGTAPVVYEISRFE